MDCYRKEFENAYGSISPNSFYIEAGGVQK